MTTETTEIIVFDEVMGKLAEFKEANANIVYDVRDPQGNKDCRSHIASLRKFKTRIAEVHKDAKREALEYGRRLDGLKNKYTAEVVEMIDIQKAPLDEVEAEKQAKIDEDVRRHAEEEAKKQAEIEAKAKAYEEMKAKEEAERAEAERIVREKQIAEEAAARATAEAEAKAKLEADARERMRIDAENKAKAEIIAKEAAEQARIANEEHRAEVEEDIEKFLRNLGIGIEQTVEILTALIEDRIPHVTIIY
jgi:membrane protein involved in colicin uptake